MIRQLKPPLWLALALALAALVALYAGPLATGFLNDDYFFLEDARTRPLVESLTELGPLGNYYRPLSRQIYFAALSPIAGGHPLVFHLFNFALFVASLALLADLLRRLLPRAGVMAGLLYFALLPFHRVNLTWVSCSQDLLALTFSLAALAFWRRDRVMPAAFMWLGAIASKESALPLPVALFAWDVWVTGRAARAALRRLVPAAAIGIAWVALAFVMRLRHPSSAAFLHFDPVQFVAGYVHMLQAFLGLDHPAGFFAGLAATGPALVPLVLLAALAWWIARGGRTGAQEADAAGASATDRAAAGHAADTPGRTMRAPTLFALAWIAAFGFVTGPLAHTWSSYYYTLAAAGGALLVGVAARRIRVTGWLVLCALLLWWHAGSNATRAFAIVDRPWEWTSHLTSFYFDRAARLTETLSEQLRALEPSPPPETRFYFALLPPWAGFQMGNGPLLRDLYDDPSIESFFYSQFSESTAAGRPNRFLYWDGTSLRPLYEEAPYFRVGCDLLLLDRPEGAAYAFRRGLQEGEPAIDTQYWLGWAELWRGNRAAAEAAWLAFGARDDSLRWVQHMEQARAALEYRADTLDARRQLMTAIGYGIGRPQGHAALGQIMRARGSRFGLLELKVAARLDPDDWQSRRGLVVGLTDARLDDPARAVLDELARTYRGWRADSALARVAEVLESRAPSGSVARFGADAPASAR